ncbi:MULTISPECIES: hypothetical protein [Hymenobacter]|uniref:Uncharacterized protein n=2 Tax=Hymenobacter TaxID=89966 RepID=A0A4Z0MDN0_9BACT|nr:MULTISPECIES: hypothetical protein [Hymenobacter]RSK24596.1 hypothetical protein EI290_19815 [Hymenobacter metallilatus]TGD77335.1 hypothetical protein EU557_23520 [Hymenobacter wooponensis]
MQQPTSPERQEAYYKWLAQQEKEENEERFRQINEGDDLGEETIESILGDLYPNREPDEEIEIDDYE